MDDVRLAPTVGIVACLAVVLGLAVPYLLVDPSSVGAYYGAGVFNPLFAGLFVLVCVIVLAAGREGRSDPALMAGIGLVLSVFALGITAVWALTVPIDIVFSLPTDAAFAYHRYVLVVTALVVPVSSVWYARSLGLL